MRFTRLLALVAILVTPRSASAQRPAPALVPSDSNIVFGNVANAALLMDVYRPQRSNGLGIIFISGSSWGTSPGYPHDYDDIPLKNDVRDAGGYLGPVMQGLLGAGFTVFSINHRFAPESRFPEPFYDAQRAVRFIRAHAAAYRIRPEKLGAMGHSSGAQLAALLGVTDTTIANPHRFPSQSGSSHVQAVVTLAAPFVVTEVNMARPGGWGRKMILNLIGSLPEPLADGGFPMTPAIAAASPLTRVTSAAAPMLMYQAKDDPVVLATSAPKMAARLTAVGVPNQLVTRPSGMHTPQYDVAEVVDWFTRYLR